MENEELVSIRKVLSKLSIERRTKEFEKKLGNVVSNNESNENPV